MDRDTKYLMQFHVEGMWNRYNLHWSNINQDVNILIGINGSGKTTLLNLIYNYYNNIKVDKNIVGVVSGNEINIPVLFIRSFDVPTNYKKKTESALLQDLKRIINQNGEGSSFFDYRMRMLNYPQEADKIGRRINHFFKVVNTVFKDTNKKVIINPTNNSLAFSLEGTERHLLTSDGLYLTDTKGNRLLTSPDMIQLEQLSSGEKQMLLILTAVFLQEEKPCVLLMDEPEISMHINWQDSLINNVKELNPYCQLIISTHSPNIFANGWEDKIVFIEDLEDGM